MLTNENILGKMQLCDVGLNYNYIYPKKTNQIAANRIVGNCSYCVHSIDTKCCMPEEIEGTLDMCISDSQGILKAFQTKIFRDIEGNSIGEEAAYKELRIMSEYLCKLKEKVKQFMQSNEQIDWSTKYLIGNHLAAEQGIVLLDNLTTEMIAYCDAFAAIDL